MRLGRGSGDRLARRRPVRHAPHDASVSGACFPIQRSGLGAAECLLYDFLRAGRSSIASLVAAPLGRACEEVDEVVERLEVVASDGGGDDLLYEVVPREKAGVRRCHATSPLGGSDRALDGDALAPAGEPGAELLGELVDRTELGWLPEVGELR